MKLRFLRFILLWFFGLSVLAGQVLAACDQTAQWTYWCSGCSGPNNCSPGGNCQTSRGWVYDSSCGTGCASFIEVVCDPQGLNTCKCGGDAPPPTPCGKCEGCANPKPCSDLGNWDGPGGVCERAGCVEDFGKCGGGTYCSGYACSNEIYSTNCNARSGDGCSWHDYTGVCMNGCSYNSGDSCGQQYCTDGCGARIADGCSYTPCCTNTRPAPVSLLTPGNGATKQPLSLSLVVNHPAGYSWGTNCAGTDTHTLSFYLNGTLKCTNTAVPANSNTISASCAISGLSYDTLYSWYVVAANGNGLSTQSSTYTFRTIAFPAWWQATEGDIYATGTIRSQIPVTCTGACKAYIELD